jgi:carbamoyltransferase
MSVAEPWVLGLAASHNGGACLLQGNRVAVAIQEERLVRCKRARVVGAQRCLSIPYCLQAAGIDWQDLSAIGFTSPLPFADPLNDLREHPDLENVIQRVPTIYVTHHRAHAIAAVATSGFSEATVLVVDGAGSPPQDMLAAEIAAAVGATDGPETISIYHAGARDLLALAKEFGFWLQPRPVGMPIFGSLGGMYSAVSQQIFGDTMEAGKVMGLAPYGRASIRTRDFVELDGCRCFFPVSVQSAM